MLADLWNILMTSLIQFAFSFYKISEREQKSENNKTDHLTWTDVTEILSPNLI